MPLCFATFVGVEGSSRQFPPNGISSALLIFPGADSAGRLQFFGNFQVSSETKPDRAGRLLPTGPASSVFPGQANCATELWFISKVPLTSQESDSQLPKFRAAQTVCGWIPKWTDLHGVKCQRQKPSSSTNSSSQILGQLPNSSEPQLFTYKTGIVTDSGRLFLHPRK